MLYLIDDEGRVARQSADLSARFGTTLAGPDLAAYMVKNSGFMALKLDPAETELRLRPDRVRPGALANGLHELLRSLSARYVVTWFAEQAWHSEEFTGRNRAVQLVADLVAAAELHARASDFLTRPRPVERLAADSPLRPLIGAWRSGTRSAEAIQGLADSHVHGRFVSVLVGDDNGLYLAHLGRNYDHNVREALLRSPSRRYCDWPDVHYGRWIDRNYRQTMECDQPTLDDLDLFINWPHLGRRNYTYTRLILPCDNEFGSRILVGCSVIDAGVNLRAVLH